MQPAINIFAGIVLAGTVAGHAMAAQPGLSPPDVSSTLNAMIDARMAAELQHDSHRIQLVPGKAGKVRVLELGTQEPANGACPCYEYVYHWSHREPTL